MHTCDKGQLWGNQSEGVRTGIEMRGAVCLAPIHRIRLVLRNCTFLSLSIDLCDLGPQPTGRLAVEAVVAAVLSALTPVQWFMSAVCMP